VQDHQQRHEQDGVQRLRRDQQRDERHVRQQHERRREHRDDDVGEVEEPGLAEGAVQRRG
jgi:hypothetical protein